MVDLLGHDGFLNEAHGLIKSMPVETAAIVEGNLLGFFRICENVKPAEEIALHLIELEPECCIYQVFLYNIHQRPSVRWRYKGEEADEGEKGNERDQM